MFDLALWSMCAVIVVGLIQWAKGLFPKLNSTVWSAALPIASFLAALAYGGDKVMWNMLGTWAIAQLGYEVIIQTVKSKLTKEC